MNSTNSKFSIIKFKNKLKKERHLLTLIAVCTALLVVCVFISIFHVKRIYDTFRDNSYDYIFNRSELTGQYFSENFNRKGTLVQTEADVLGSLDAIDKENVCNALRVLEDSGEFVYARYISNRGVKYKSNGSLNSTLLINYTKAMSESMGVSVYRNFDSEKTNDEICFGVPVTKNGIIQGYLVGVSSATSMFQAFAGNGTDMTVIAERYMADSRGDIVAYIKNNTVYDGTGKNIYDLLTRDCIDDFAAQQEKEEIQNELIESQMINRNISINGREGYALYVQLRGANGWTLFYIVYNDSVQEQIQFVLVESFIAVFGVVLIMALMAALIFSYIRGEQKKVYDLAYVDELTSAPNENAFKERAVELIRDNPDVPYVVTCFDIQNFRYINEGYGHEKADMLLRAVAGALRESYTYNECFARLSADRFLGLCVDDERTEERKKFVMDKVTAACEAIPMKYPVNFKTGIYYVRNRNEDISDMIDKANLARKSARSAARQNIAEYRDQLMEETRRQEHVESRMHEALANGEFVPFLQPKWDMLNDHICGAEALIRWITPDGGVVPPGDFIPVFEKNGFVEQIDFFMLEKICEYLRKMIDEGREVYPVSINQSRYLLFDPNYISRVQAIMLKYRVPKGLIELEITETVFFSEKERMLEVMRQLKEFNMNLSIDDFGSGYSSLNLLRDIPFDVLKIDREFLDESSQSETGKWILRKIVEMAEGMHLKVICEGVETHEQVEMLLSIGCQMAQGFLYSRPIPIEEFMEKFNSPLDEYSPEYLKNAKFYSSDEDYEKKSDEEEENNEEVTEETSEDTSTEAAANETPDEKESQTP